MLGIQHIRFIALLASLVLAPSIFAQDVEVVATVNESTVGVDEQVVYSLEIKGANISSIATPDPPSTRNLTLLQRTPSTQRNMTIINGNLEQSVGFKWAFRPVRVGEARLDAAEVVVDGRTYTTQPIRLDVVAQSQRPSRAQSGRRQQWPFTYPSPQSDAENERGDISPRDLFVRAVPSSRQAIRNQQVTIEYQLFFRDGIQLRHSRLAGSWDAEGFWREEFEVDTRPIPRSVVENGLLYHMIVLKRVAVFPTREGRLTIDPLEIETEAFLPRGSSDPFERFFSLRSQFETVALASEPVHLEVATLPEDAPEAFRGAVGSYRLEASLNRDDVEVGEAIEVEITVSGTGNLATLAPPDFRPPGVFERYDPNVTTTINRDAEVIRGSKTFTHLLVPRSNGEFELPPIEFVYFDPSDGRYVAARAELGTVRVSGSAVPLAAGSTADGLPVDDIAGIMTTASWERADRSPLHTSIWPYLLLAFVPLGVAAFWMRDRRRRRLAADTAYARRKAAHPLAKKHLRKAEALLQRDQAALFYEEIERAVVGFIGNRLNVSELGLTRAALSERLEAFGVDRSEIDRLNELLIECDRARYAPIKPDRASMERAHESAAALIVAIDEAIERRPHVEVS